MLTTSARMKTFVVRVWSEPPRDGQALHGTVEPIGTGESTSFTDVGQLLAVLRGEAPDERGTGTGGASR